MPLLLVYLTFSYSMSFFFYYSATWAKLCIYFLLHLVYLSVLSCRSTPPTTNRCSNLFLDSIEPCRCFSIPLLSQPRTSSGASPRLLYVCAFFPHIPLMSLLSCTRRIHLRTKSRLGFLFSPSILSRPLYSTSFESALLSLSSIRPHEYWWTTSFSACSLRSTDISVSSCLSPVLSGHNPQSAVNATFTRRFGVSQAFS